MVWERAGEIRRGQSGGGEMSDVIDKRCPVCGSKEFAIGPDSEVWRRLLRSGSSMMADILLRGDIALRVEAKTNEVYATSCAYETEFEGLRCIAMNRMCCNSKAFDPIVDPVRHDAMLTWGWRGGKWTVSLYAAREDVDVSVIARRYGGGGHKGAAGFQCRGELPAGVRP